MNTYNSRSQTSFKTKQPVNPFKHSFPPPSVQSGFRLYHLQSIPFSHPSYSNNSVHGNATISNLPLNCTPVWLGNIISSPLLSLGLNLILTNQLHCRSSFTRKKAAVQGSLTPTISRENTDGTISARLTQIPKMKKSIR